MPSGSRSSSTIWTSSPPSGYLPVTNDGFTALFGDLNSVENEKYRMLYSAVSEQYEGGYSFCSLPLYEGASDTQKGFEKLMKSTLAAAHEAYVSGEGTMEELTAQALESVRQALR